MGLAVIVPSHPGGAVAAPPAPITATRSGSTLPAGADVQSLVPHGSHTVRQGDTLSGVARRYGTTASALAAANGLADPNLILPGSVLTIPSTTDAGVVDPGGAAATGSSSHDLPSRLQASPTRLAYRPIFARWAEANGIPLDLLEAMTWLESGWQNGVVSPDGAMGIGQLMPDTADHMEMLIGVDLDPVVVEDNIRMSARYLRWLLARTGTAEAALAGYYQGLGSVERNGRFADTEAYVDNVIALRTRF